MYLKKIEGPRSVKLPNGKFMTVADLPPKDTKRWVASRKAAVVKGVAYGLISKTQACREYSVSNEEFESWCQAIAVVGEEALRTTVLRKYIQP